MDEKTEQAKSLILGATGLVGGYIVQHLLRAGGHPLALSRSPQSKPGVDWFCGDLEQPETLKFPPFATLYCTADATLLPAALPHLFHPSLTRAIVFSSTSVLTKLDSEVVAEREKLQALADAEKEIGRASCRERV